MEIPLCRLILLLLFAEFLVCVRHYVTYDENLSVILMVILKGRSFYPHFGHNKIEAREIT